MGKATALSSERAINESIRTIKFVFSEVNTSKYVLDILKLD